MGTVRWFFKMEIYMKDIIVVVSKKVMEFISKRQTLNHMKDNGILITHKAMEYIITQMEMCK